MKELLWKLCCTIWHFDERVIQEYKETQYKELKELEEKYWKFYKKRKVLYDELETDKIDIKEDNFPPYHYGNVITGACDYQYFWKNIYNILCKVGTELGKYEELNDLENKRHLN